MGIFQTLRRLNEKHENLKRFVHEGMRVPLPWWGRTLMGFVYFTIPVVGGLSIMNWSINKAHESIGEDGQFLPDKSIHGHGDTVEGDDGERLKVGAGGWGGGVRLAVSDEETQKINREALDKFFAEQKKLRRRRARPQNHPEESEHTN